MVAGDFEVHLTGAVQDTHALEAFASRRGAKFTHILLNSGETPSQPMLTVQGSGTLEDLHRLTDAWRADLAAEGLGVVRVKIEAAPWNEGVPESDLDASDELYFEHHVKVLLPSDDGAADRLRWAIADTGAAVSRNARRQRGRHEERFVTQRCRGVGRATARTRLDALLAALRDKGYEVLEVEEEYVVHDDALHVDRGWLDPERWGDRHTVRDDLFGSGTSRGLSTPATFRPLAADGRDIRQRPVFDPALKHFGHAFRAGEPVFGDPADGTRWSAARRAAMTHVLAVLAASPWAGHLVLRGSVALRAWLGEVAREPGDLDFVVVPRTFAPDGPEARAMLAGLVAAIGADPGPGLRADQVVAEHIWTYERVPGRRLVFPFDVAGLPQGAVQVDLVFNEDLPDAPVTVEVPPRGTRVLAASPALSLAWKLQWLVTDLYPQGKDLYDAVLLAERTSVPLELVRDLIRPELGAEADGFTWASVLDLDVDWDNFRAEHPGVGGDARPWLRRLADALTAGG
ncbi:nucleotidyltransferase AbiEii toxin of type IV toxin-antitoxin system [Saccharothrix saharensis]|uniref:Nucleotidyltransferase AbiEii toxin of type IV toxin-antitoxin system n=1 Tax=Saccharothrix saharensis TaxID=571190 RepID=A0A543J6V6_9PSEU|nr:nucleotidyl transferase AbiEii/AbiGii toxin family protein [Saccharothrix saharensis]TQM78522.1 nucleotidyltransferase AbiEii toxin of type IV toxin-antitoxin system [Saccharothrix saharensis]